MDTYKQLAPVVAAIAFIIFGFYWATGKSARQCSWLIPSALSIGFTLITLAAVLSEGLMGFWPEHIRNLWGNQIWFDLLLAASIAWILMVPEAKKLSMRPVPWFIFIACTGCIGFMAMLARLLYLREQNNTKLGPLKSSS